MTLWRANLNMISLIYLCSILSMGYTSSLINAKIVNDRPIIGVLAQELSRSLEGVYGEQNYSSFIAASYVKYLEGAGARVVPIMINQDDTYYENTINSINGILIPGGANFYNESGYGKAGRILYNLAVDLNERGDYFPVWGTCLGFELLVYIMAGKNDPREVCDAWDRADPLDFEPAYLQSNLLSTAPDNILDILAHQNVTANFHRWCVTKEAISNYNLDTKLNVLATSVDSNGLRYVAAYESKSMPLYGVQFHPEKNMYEWNTREKNIPHSTTAISSATYFADFFVNEARKSGHSFDTPENESSHLIYNYSPTYTGAENLLYEQCYFFTDKAQAQ